MDSLAARFGTAMLVIARPVPVFAEASVLLFGAARLPWRRFFTPVALSNLGIAAVYAMLGEWVRLPTAMGASIAIPAIAFVFARILWRRIAGMSRHGRELTTGRGTIENNVETPESSDA